MNLGRRELALACLLYALALALYLPGYGRLLPYDPEPDNYVVVQVEQLDAGLAPAQRLDKFKSYPLLTASLARALPRLPRAVHAAGDADAQLRESLSSASEPSLRVRLVVALLSALLAPFTYLLARKFLEPGPSFGAALLAGTSLLVAVFSNQARPHGAHAALSVLGVLAALAVLERPSWSRYLLAGLACAASVVTLQTGWFTFATLGVAHLHVQRRAKARGEAVRERAARWLRLGAAFAVVACAAWICLAEGPYVARSSGLQGTQLHLGSHIVELGWWNGGGWRRLANTLIEYEPVLAALALLALLAHLPSIRRWNADPRACVVASYPILYTGVWGHYGLTYERYWMPLVPYLALLSAWLVTRVVTRLASERARRVVAPAAWALVLAFPTWVCVRLAFLRTEETTVELAARWIRENVDASSARVALTPQLNLPLWYAASALEQPVVPKTAGDWIRYQRAHPPPEGATRYELANLPFDIAAAPPGADARLFEAWWSQVAATHVLCEVSQWMKTMPTVTALRARARTNGELVYATPDDRPTDAGRRTSLYQSTHAPIERILHLDRLGPRIEIWKLR